MKNIFYSFVLASCVITFSCSGSNTAQKNVNSQPSTNVAGPTEVASSTTAVSPTATPNHESVAQEKTPDDKAREFMNGYLKTRLVECDASWYWASTGTRRGGRNVYQCRNSPSIDVSGQSFSARELSEAERLNRIDPLPVEWEGSVDVRGNTCRIQSNSEQQWSKWFDSLGFIIKYKKVHADWQIIGEFSETHDKLLTLSCSDIRKFLKTFPQDNQ